MLTSQQIIDKYDNNELSIQPFNTKHLGPNSYDVHLARTIYKLDRADQYVDPYDEKSCYFTRITIPEQGYIIHPGSLYLGVTEEWTDNRNVISCLEGVSTNARFGLSIHQTAGFGDIGFKGHWTLELSAILPIKIRAGQRIGQLCFFEPSGIPEVTYAQVGHYNNVHRDSRSKHPEPTLPKFHNV